VSTAVSSAGALRAPAIPRLGARGQRVALPALGILAALALWQLVSAMHWLGLWVDYVSNPIDAASAGWKMTTSGELWTNAQGSIEAFAIGFGLSAAVGIPLGLVMGWNRTVRQVLEPPMNLLNATPRLALLPVIVVWLGIGVKSTVVVVFLDAVIPVIINGMAGVRDVDVRLVQVARSFGANRRELLRKILLPASTPAILTGVRLGVARGVLGVVVAQLYVSTVGIGHLIATYGQQFQVDQVVFLVLLVAVFAYVVNVLLRRLESHFESWRGAA
jgi:ABC-type nitrate/sulfonate/bicarbonate transport system permease component